MTPQEIQELNSTFGQFKTANDAALAEFKALGAVSTATAEKVAKIEKDLDTKVADLTNAMTAKETAYKAQEAILLQKMQDLEAAISRKGGTHFKEDADEKKAAMLEARRVFFKALGSGASKHALKEHLTADEYKFFETKVLSLGNDAAGGYLAPFEYVQEIIKDIVQYSPIRSVARTRTTTRSAVLIPKRTQTASAVWVGELETRSETQNPNWALEQITPHEMAALAKVSRVELEDSVFDLQQILREEFAEQFGVTEGIAFISGTGTKQPEGILTSSAIEIVNSGDATHLTPDGLLDLYFSLKEQYLNNSTWAMSRSTLREVRKMKDGEGNYLWAPGIKTDARPATLLDRPYITAPDMPAIAADAKPIAFGDFGRGYLIVDRLDMEMMADPYTSKNQGMIEFSARKRVGGQVILPEAIKIMKVSA